MVGYVLITWVSGSGRADLGLRGSLRPRYQQVLPITLSMDVPVDVSYQLTILHNRSIQALGG